jgi:urease accessory protein
MLLLLLVHWPDSSFAHYAQMIGDDAGGLVAGLEHPVLGLDHALAMVLVGVWAVQLGAAATWLLPATFLIAMANGGLAGQLDLLLPGREIGIPLSIIVLGGMVAREARPPLWIAALLVGFFATYHGQAHATDRIGGEAGFLYFFDYGIGLMLAAGLLQLAGIGIGLIQRWKGGEVVIRIGGCVVSLAGGALMWNALT